MSIIRTNAREGKLDSPESRVFFAQCRDKKRHHPNSHQLSIRQITDEFCRKFKLKVHISTVRRYLIRLDLYGPWERDSRKA